MMHRLVFAKTGVSTDVAESKRESTLAQIEENYHFLLLIQEVEGYRLRAGV